MVGDFSEEDIESSILDYLGTVRPTKGFEKAQQYSPILFSTAPFGLQHQQVRKDCFSVYIFFPAFLWMIILAHMLKFRCQRSQFYCGRMIFHAFIIPIHSFIFLLN